MLLSTVSPNCLKASEDTRDSESSPGFLKLTQALEARSELQPPQKHRQPPPGLLRVLPAPARPPGRGHRAREGRHGGRGRAAAAPLPRGLLQGARGGLMQTAQRSLQRPRESSAVRILEGRGRKAFGILRVPPGVFRIFALERVGTAHASNPWPWLPCGRRARSATSCARSTSRKHHGA